jgi:Tfp pilus assembly protein PilN
MKPGAAVLQAPALPQVNLLPGDVRQARTLGVVKRWVIASAGLTVLTVGSVAGAAQLQAQDAASRLARANAESAAMLAEQRPLAQVTGTRDQVTALTAARAFGLGQEILWADYLGGISIVIPPGVGITTLDYTGATPLTAAPVSTDPLVPAGLGTITFTALGREVQDTAAWADSLESLPGLRDARISGTVRNDESGTFTYEFTGTIQVDAGALAHRFDAEPEGDS